MEVHSGDANSFLDEFHGRRTEMFAAVLFLSIRACDQRVIEEIADAVLELDDALGEGIGFFLFGPQFNSTLELKGKFVAGRRMNTQRERLQQSRAASEYFANVDPSHYGKPYESEIREIVARSTAAIAPQFCNIFRVDQSQLPAICAVVRGSSDAIVVPYKGAFDLPRFMDAAKKINERIHDLQGRSNVAMEGIASVQRRVESAAKWEADIERNEVRLIAFSKALETELNIVVSPQIIALVRTGGATDERIDELFLRYAPASVGALRHDIRYKGIKSCLGEIKQLRGRFSELADREKIESLSQNERFLGDMAGEITAEVAAVLRELGYPRNALRSRVRELAPWAERAVKFAETGHKLSQLLADGGYGQGVLNALRSAGRML